MTLKTGWECPKLKISEIELSNVKKIDNTFLLSLCFKDKVLLYKQLIKIFIPNGICVIVGPAGCM